eukprot:tig00021070_g17858.t1
MAAGGSPFDALPDELVSRIIGEASEWSYFEIGLIKECSGSHRCSDQILDELVRLSHISRRFRSLAQQPGLWQRIQSQLSSDRFIDALLDQPRKRREALRSLVLANGDPSGDSFIKLSKCFGGQLTQLGMLFEASDKLSSIKKISIDYFVSGTDVEPPGAAAHYGERLLLLPGLAQVVYPLLRKLRAVLERARRPVLMAEALGALGSFELIPNAAAGHDVYLQLLAQARPALPKSIDGF